MPDPNEPLLLEFSAEAVPAPPGTKPTRTILPANLGVGEPVWVEFVSTAEPAPPHTPSTRSKRTPPPGESNVPLSD